VNASANLVMTLETADGRLIPLEFAVRELVIAGWTGRDSAAMEAHIRELEALGVQRPKTTPIFYRVAASLLTTAAAIQVAGSASSGEVETVLFRLADGLWVGVGSDHTDRKIEAISVTASKQMCAKPVGATLWRLEDIGDHWERLILRSFAVSNSRRRLYQEGPVSRLRHPRELAALYAGEGAELTPGTAMFCGTLAALGALEGADAFEIELEDPMLRRKISHAYRIETLPVEG
jgi:Protein of unknown function (DUF2848)